MLYAAVDEIHSLGKTSRTARLAWFSTKNKHAVYATSGLGTSVSVICGCYIPKYNLGGFKINRRCSLEREHVALQDPAVVLVIPKIIHDLCRCAAELSARGIHKTGIHGGG